MTDATETERSTAEAPSEYDLTQRSLPVELLAFAGVVAGALVAAHIYWNTIGIVPDLWKTAIHFAGFGCLGVLFYPALRGPGALSNRRLLWLDVPLAILAIAAPLYVAWGESAIYARGTDLAPLDWIATCACLVLALEIARRSTGWVIPIIVLVALSYLVLWGQWIDGMLHFPGLSLENTVFRAFYTDEGLFGQIALISATSVFMFILFGAFLVASGASAFIIDFANVVAGRLIGGPGYVAVISSGLMGTISGSAIANTAATGIITIPLMKRSGFPARFAAAVEASASTGGQLMPPIMGAGAFIMATFTAIPYTTIIAVAALPALMYFLSVALFVRIEAKKQNLRPIPADDVPSLGQLVARRGLTFIVPIGVLIGLLVAGYTPPYAAGAGILAVIAVSWLTPHRMTPDRIFAAVVMGARNMTTTAVVLVAVGGIVLTVQTTGIGNTISLMLTQWAGGSLLLTIVLVALASLVLGMGLPVTAAYIVTATLAAPAIAELITEQALLDAFVAGNLPGTVHAGLMLSAPDLLPLLERPLTEPEAAQIIAALPRELFGMVQEETLSPAVITTALLSAHMIIFWLSQDSNVTPPVCLCAFTAASIAKTPQMATGLSAWKIAKGIYLVPLLFAYSPILSGDWGEAVVVFAFGMLGLYAAIGAIEGYLEYRLSLVERLLMAAVAFALFWPTTLWVHLAGAVAFVLLFAFGIWRSRLARPHAAA